MSKNVAILKQYPDHVNIYIPKGDIFNERDSTNEYNHDNRKSNSNQDFLQKSIDRTHSIIRDYILCNDFDWFLTLTISPDVCDRLDDKAVQKALKYYFDNIRRHNSIEYILVPERHKNGALHFHGLINIPPDYPLTPTKKRDSAGRPRFQDEKALKMLGFNDWTRIGSKDALSQYVRKYITKNLITTPGKKRVFASRNLKKPDKHYIDINELPDEMLESMIELDYAYFGNFGI